MKENESFEFKIITYLSPRLASFWSMKRIICPDEIRLTQGAPLIIVKDGKALIYDMVINSDDINYTLRVLTSNSMYAHTDTLNEGYITSRDGIRAGVVGRATVSSGKINSVCGICSIVLRIPRRFNGASHKLCEYVAENVFKKNVILCAPPSGGKTTALREFAIEITSKPYNIPTALIDTRCELTTGRAVGTLCTMSGYPRNKGIEIAVRTLSPKLIITDEINSDDKNPLKYSEQSGVCYVASAHGSAERFITSELWDALSQNGNCVLCNISKRNGSFDFDFKEA